MIQNPRPVSNGEATSLAPPPKPTPLPVRPKHIPADLRDLPQWVVWKYVWNPDKKRKDGSGEKGDWDKPLFNARTGGHASSTDKDTWCSLPTTLAAYREGGWDGIGFVLTDTNELIGGDLDHCRDPKTGELEKWAEEIVEEVGTYCEVSPSGTGIRFIARGKKRHPRCRKGPFEVYTTGRYLTITGHRLPDAPEQILKRPRAILAICERMFGPVDPSPTTTPTVSAPAPEANGKLLDDDDLIARAKTAKNGAKFTRLWNGETSGYTSHSEAVLALCAMLAFWTGPDAARIDQLFRKSGLFSGAWRDEKWDRVGADTIRRVLAERTEYYCPPTDSSDSTGKGKTKAKDSQATRVVELVRSSGAEFFHTPGSDSEAYVSLPINGHRETWPVESTAFSKWLRMTVHKALGKVPSGQAMTDAVRTLAGQALFDGPEHPVAVRLAEHDRFIWLDLGGPDWLTVRVGPDGWEVVADCPVRFTRRRGMLALPAPVKGGSLKELRKLINLPDADSWMLFKAWMVATLRPDRPFPVLTVNGEQGSAKTTLCRMARGLIDPNEAPLRLRPKNSHDLIIAARNGWVVAFDNLSGIGDELSDALCCLATGGGFGTRLLYTDEEEKLFSAKRPVMLNGIEDVATRPDLIDRAVALTLPTITDDRRHDEDTLWRRYERVRPKVLGAFLDAVAVGLRNLPGVKLDSKPRMADFVTWAVACCPALDMTGDQFLAAYNRNRAVANEAALETSPIVRHLMDLAEKKTWTGTAASLLSQLESNARDDEKRKKFWPQSARGLSGALQRLLPNLRRAGIIVTFTGEYSRHGRLIRIERRSDEHPPEDE